MSKNTPTLSPFESLASLPADQLQLRANAISSLDIIGDDCRLHGRFKDVSFPNLEYVNIDSSEDNRVEVLGQYLQPRLKRFQLFGGYLSDEFLLELARKCPELEEVLIDNPRDSITTGGLLQFLQECKSLTKFGASYDFENIFTEQVLTHLVNRQNLTSLSFCLPLTAKNQHLMDGNPFPNLTDLSCFAEPQAFIALSRHLSGLKKLALVPINTNDDPFLPRVAASCPNLQILEIHYQDPVTISPDELTPLASQLPALRELELHGKNITVSPPFQDGHVAKLAGDLKLSRLELEFKCECTHEALKELAKSHGDTLGVCEIWADCDIAALEAENVKFRALSELTIGQARFSSPQTVDASRAGGAVDALRRMAPWLASFNVVGEGEFEKELQAAWREFVQ